MGCAVFAETEAISFLTRGTSREDLLAGLHQSLAARILAMARAGGGPGAWPGAGGGAGGGGGGGVGGARGRGVVAALGAALHARAARAG